MLPFFQTTFVVVVIFVIDVITAIHILMHKHETPVSATLWLFVVFSFPILGVILYLFLGINRVKTLGFKIALANEIIDAEQKKRVHTVINQYLAGRDKFTYDAYKQLESAMDYNQTIDRLLPKTTPLLGNKVELLRNGTAAYPQMLNAIKNAKHNIHLQSFIIHNDAIGKEILDALAQKAMQDVEVKLLYDKFGSLKACFSHFFAKYKQRKIKNFHMQPFALTNIFAPWRSQLRNHRKVLVVDGKIAFVGGINISSINDIRVCGKDTYIHDLHCKIQGPSVAVLQRTFLRDWHYASKTSPSDIFQTEYFPKMESCGESVVRIIDSGPGQRDDATEKMFLMAAATAQKELCIMTPYFTPDQPFMTALIMAAARGVMVKIIVPKKNNHRYAQFASRSLYRTLLTNHVRIFEKPGVFSHSKAMLIDNKWAYMGSSNCDVRSFRLDYELDFVVAHDTFIEDLQRQFVREFGQAEEITLEQIANKKASIKLLENLCSLLIPVL